MVFDFLVVVLGFPLMLLFMVFPIMISLLVWMDDRESRFVDCDKHLVLFRSSNGRDIGL